MTKMKNKTIIAVILVCLPLVSRAQSAELTCWTEKGELFKLTIEGSVLEVPSDVAAVDLRNAGQMTLDCSSANPNCLFYTDGATSVEGLPNANVVCDGICDGLLLTDNASFFCPMAFTATDAMLRFTPRRDDDMAVDFSQPCYETVFLPFDADMVVPADADGPMPYGWLQTAIYDECIDNLLLFFQTDAGHLTANTPYLVRFAYAAYGTNILFCGQNKTVAKTQTVYLGEELSPFAGTTISEDEASDYYRYYRGEEPYFIHTGDGKPMEPFRCFIAFSNIIDPSASSGTDQMTEQIIRYALWEESSTGFSDTMLQKNNRHHTMNSVYDLKGRKVKAVYKKGIYITDGVKILR